MSVQIEQNVVALDDNTAQWLKQYREALTKIKEWEEVADIARSHLETALGDNEIALYQGKEVVRWTKVESTRFDVKRAREILDAKIVEALTVPSVSRRFSIVEQ